MPDKRTHRGPHPEDVRLFSTDAVGVLRQAAGEWIWLANHGYAANSSLKLVGDRYRLTRRQRNALSRAVCSDAALADRRGRRVLPGALRNSPLLVDGYNVLTTIEAALAGGVVLAGRDGAYRDMASVHGTFRRVAETVPAIRLLGEVTRSWGVPSCRWFLDRPVSNSGRLKVFILEVAASAGHDWDVELVADPDKVLAAANETVVTADSGILDRCGRWVSLARHLIDTHVPGAWVVDFVSPPDATAAS